MQHLINRMCRCSHTSRGREQERKEHHYVSLFIHVIFARFSSSPTPPCRDLDVICIRKHNRWRGKHWILMIFHPVTSNALHYTFIYQSQSTIKNWIIFHTRDLCLWKCWMCVVSTCRARQFLTLTIQPFYPRGKFSVGVFSKQIRQYDGFINFRSRSTLG